MIRYIKTVFLVLMLCSPLAQADALPSPENVAIEGNLLTWDEVPGATGYNIYVGYTYFDTVKGSTQYSVSQAGEYWVVAFDDDGNFGSQYHGGSAPEYGGLTDDISVTDNYYASVVQKTCRDVGPGESCIASCQSASHFTLYMSGGACSTSDIVEADAFVGNQTYKCTVPTFSGEVVAQAICVHY